MQDLIQRAEAWLKLNRPGYYAQLRPGVTDAQLDAYEAQFDLMLPSALRDLYRWRDGQDVDFSEAFFDNHLFIPLEHSASSKELLDGMIGYDFEDPAWWRRGWVPFTESYGGDHECVDVDAEGGGTPGQVLSFWHDEARRKIKGDSVEAWFGALVDKMEDGRLEWD